MEGRKCFFVVSPEEFGELLETEGTFCFSPARFLELSVGGEQKNPVGRSSNLWVLRCFSFPSSQALKIGLGQKKMQVSFTKCH